METYCLNRSQQSPHLETRKTPLYNHHDERDIGEIPPPSEDCLEHRSNMYLSGMRDKRKHSIILVYLCLQLTPVVCLFGLGTSIRREVATLLDGAEPRRNTALHNNIERKLRYIGSFRKPGHVFARSTCGNARRCEPSPSRHHWDVAPRAWIFPFTPGI